MASPHLTRPRRGLFLAAGTLIAFGIGVVVVDSMYFSNPARGAVQHGAVRGGPLTGPVLHIVRIDSTGMVNETWTSVSDGLTKLVQKDPHGAVVNISTKAEQADNSFVVTETDAYRAVHRSYTVPSVGANAVPEGIWYGGESSLAAMRAEFAGYLRQAGAHVVQTTLNGTPVRRFDAVSSDGLWGTVWLNDAGLPVQVQSATVATPNTFPLIEQLPASSLSRDFLTSSAAFRPGTGASQAPRAHAHP